MYTEPQSGSCHIDTFIDKVVVLYDKIIYYKVVFVRGDFSIDFLNPCGDKTA